MSDKTDENAIEQDQITEKFITAIRLQLGHEIGVLTSWGTHPFSPHIEDDAIAAVKKIVDKIAEDWKYKKGN